MSEKIPGGLAKGMSIRDLVTHHGKDSWASIQFESLEKQLEKELEKGIEVEMEHTTNKSVAREIAMDHLYEDPKYYTKLKKVETSESTIRTSLRKFLNEEYNRAEYLKWKRNNVTLRGIKNPGEENGGGESLGRGLYTAFLGNKAMAKEYGHVHYVVNAIPKHPLKFNSLNDWEIWFGNVLLKNYSNAAGLPRPDKRHFQQTTSIENELQKMGYDGIIIKGREMVNFKPSDVLYFKDEHQLENYYNNVINPQH